MQISSYWSAVLHASSYVPLVLLADSKEGKDPDVLLYSENTIVTDKNLDRLATRGAAVVTQSRIQETAVHQLKAEKSLLQEVYVSGQLEANKSRFNKIHLYPKGKAHLSDCTYALLTGRGEITGELSNCLKMVHCSDFDVVLRREGQLMLDHCFNSSAQVLGSSVIVHSHLHRAELIGPVTLRESGVESLSVDVQYNLDLLSSKIGLLDVYCSDVGGTQVPTIHLTSCHVRELVFHSKMPGIVVMHGVGAIKEVRNGRMILATDSKL